MPRPGKVLLLIFVALVLLVCRLGVKQSSRSSLWSWCHGWVGWASIFFQDSSGQQAGTSIPLRNGCGAHSILETTA